MLKEPRRVKHTSCLSMPHSDKELRVSSASAACAVVKQVGKSLVWAGEPAPAVFRTAYGTCLVCEQDTVSRPRLKPTSTGWNRLR